MNEAFVRHGGFDLVLGYIEIEGEGVTSKICDIRMVRAIWGKPRPKL